ncbi:MAG: hypothetical protein QOG26_343 [Solirubrobacterales bacterium]|nr:hypothetical protein [Solirubrobacterales bacterium]
MYGSWFVSTFSAVLALLLVVALTLTAFTPVFAIGIAVVGAAVAAVIMSSLRRSSRPSTPGGPGGDAGQRPAMRESDAALHSGER